MTKLEKIERGVKRMVKNLKISYYDNVTETEGKEIPLLEALEIIKNEDNAEKVKSCYRTLKIKGKEAYSKKKLKFLDAVMFGGIYGENKTKENLIKYSQVITLDFDEIELGLGEENELESFRKDIENCPFTLAYFRSPRRNGYKVLVVVDSEAEDHEEAFRQVSSYYESITGRDVDPSGKNVNRLCYLGSDPELYLNLNCQLFEIENRPSVPPVETEITELRNSVDTTPQEEVENSEFKDSKELEVLEDIVSFCVDNSLSITGKNKSWSDIAIVIGGLKIPVESKIQSFMILARLDKKSHEESHSKSVIEKYIRESRGELTIRTLIHYAKEVGYKPKINFNAEEYTNSDIENQFWAEEDKKLIIVEHKYKKWLEEQGFFYYENYLYQKDNYLIKEKSIQDLKYFIMEYIERLPDQITENYTKDNLVSLFIRRRYELLHKSLLEFLKPVKVDMHWDTADTVYFYFRNGIVEVKANEIKLIPYKEIGQCVYEKDIIDFEVKESDIDGSSDTFEFLTNITDSNTIINSVGALLSRYKNPSENKIHIYIDDDAKGEEANGYRGKSLIFKAINRMRNVKTIDGKNLRKDHFIFQSVKPSDNIVLLDDLEENFPIEKLFSATVSDFMVEPKRGTPFVIPYAFAPKFGITTNHPLGGLEGVSAKKRKHVVKFNNHYGEHLNPEKEFGRLLFVNETEEQTQDFYGTMFYCVQIYLSEGLGKSDVEFEKDLKLKRKTNKEFFDFMTNYRFKKGEEYCVGHLLDELTEEYDLFESFERKTLFKWVRIFIRYKGWKTLEYHRTDGEELLHKKNGASYFQII